MMLKKHRKKLWISVLTLTISGIAIYALIFRLFITMDYLPKGDLMGSFESPGKTYVVNMYLTNCGATCAYAVRGELIDSARSTKRNIYFKYKEERAEVTWLDADTVVINGIELDVPIDKYDWRNE
jgi:hypothetical protein